MALVIVSLSALSHAQSPPASSAPKAYPYVFSNFIWWSDTDLRLELKKKIPGLGDTIVPFSPMESRVNNALSQILKRNGIPATVQSLEPTPQTTPPKPNIIVGIRASKIVLQNVAKPSIVFSVLAPPDILADDVSVYGSPSGLEASLAKTVKSLTGKPYTAVGYWGTWFQLQDELKANGYLSATITFDHGPYTKAADGHYLVPVKVIVDSGPQYRLGKLTIDGGAMFQNVDLSAYVTASIGDVVSPTILRELESQIRNAYRGSGYAYAEVEDEPVLDKESATASYFVTVDPGPVYHLRNLDFVNLDAYRQGKVRNLLTMQPGDLYTSDSLMQLGSALLRNPDFQDCSLSYFAREDETKHLVDVTLTFYKR